MHYLYLKHLPPRKQSPKLISSPEFPSSLIDFFKLLLTSLYVFILILPIFLGLSPVYLYIYCYSCKMPGPRINHSLGIGVPDLLLTRSSLKNKKEFQTKNAENARFFFLFWGGTRDGMGRVRERRIRKARFIFSIRSIVTMSDRIEFLHNSSCVLNSHKLVHVSRFSF